MIYVQAPRPYRRRIGSIGSSGNLGRKAKPFPFPRLSLESHCAVVFFGGRANARPWVFATAAHQSRIVSGILASQASRASRPVAVNPVPPFPTLPSSLNRTVQYH
jgi:hypothetical protein